MTKNNTIQVFIDLLQAGLWEKECRLQPYGHVDFEALFNLASDQTVVGLIAAGLERISDIKVGKMQARPFLKSVIALEQRNSSMNEFISWLYNRLNEEDISPVLVKGQGVAQCYARPMWRAAGDVDVLLSDSDYQKAKGALSSIATSVDKEELKTKHLALSLSGFDVELHGTLFTSVSRRWNQCLADVQECVFSPGGTRDWNNGGEIIRLPSYDNDVVFIFSHILQHYYKRGIGLRQICDWCRLLHTCHDCIDASLLEQRLRKMDVLDEWQAFAALAVDHLGMASSSIPLFVPSAKNSRKARKILSFIFETGNFGHRRDKSYYKKHSYLIVKAISLWRWIKDYVNYFFLFPRNSIRSFWNVLRIGSRVALKGE